MKILILALLLLIPVIGLYLVYRAYRIYFKKDYSLLKDNEGIPSSMPEIISNQAAAAHLLAGALTILSLALLGKWNLIDISKVVGVILISLKAYTVAISK